MKPIISYFRPMPVLETERLRLRRAYLTDTDDIFICTGNENICRYETWERHRSHIETLGFINDLMEKYDSNRCTEWIIEEKSLGRAIGVINLHDICEGNRYAEMGFWIAEDTWHKGYASEAARAVTDFAFSVLGLNKLGCMCATENTASEKVLLRLGMTLEGILRKHINIKGSFSDIKYFSILREEYVSKH